MEQGAVVGHVHDGGAKLLVVGQADLAAEVGAHGLLAVADAEDGEAGVEDQLRHARAGGVQHGGRAAGEDVGAGAEGGDAGRVGGGRHDLAIHAGFAHAACDELGELAAEVQDQDAVLSGGGIGRLGGGLGHGRGLQHGRGCCKQRRSAAWLGRALPQQRRHGCHSTLQPASAKCRSRSARCSTQPSNTSSAENTSGADGSKIRKPPVRPPSSRTSRYRPAWGPLVMRPTVSSGMAIAASRKRQSEMPASVNATPGSRTGDSWASGW